MSDFLDNSNFGSSFLNSIEDIGLGGVGPPKKSTLKVEETKAPPPKTNTTRTEKKADPKPVNKTENNKKSAPSKSGGSKRPPRAPLMNLGDLTAILPPATTPLISPIPKSAQDSFTAQKLGSNSNSNPYFNPLQPSPPQTHPIIAIIENRLTNYLQASLKSLANEFINTLPTLFPDDDLVSQAVSSCVQDLQEKIRSSILFNVEQNQSNSNNFSTIFTSYAPLFRDIYFEAERAKGKDYSVFDNNIREARASASSTSTAFHTQIQESLEEFTGIVNDLNYSRMNLETASRTYKKNHAHVLETYNLLEMRKAELEADAKILESKTKHLEAEQDRNNVTSEIDVNDLVSIANETLDSIRLNLNSVDVLTNIRKDSYNIEMTCDDISQMRQMKYYQMQEFQDQLAMASSVTYTYNTQRQIQDDSTPLAIESSIADDENQVLTPSHELKKRLRSLSMARKESLQKATDFMDNVRRGERRRTRKQVTDISLLSSV